MLHLIAAHRYFVRVKHQDVGGHQHGVTEQAHGDAIIRLNASRFVFIDRRFIRVGTVHQALAGHTAQHPGQFRNFWNIGLTVERYFFHIQATSNPSRRDSAAGDGYALRVVTFDQGVVISHEEKCVDIGLLASTDSRTNRPSIVAQVWNTGRGNAGQYSCRHDKKYAYKTTCQGSGIRRIGHRPRSIPTK